MKADTARINNHIIFFKLMELHFSVFVLPGKIIGKIAVVSAIIPADISYVCS
jgi:hypothetical protein